MHYYLSSQMRGLGQGIHFDHTLLDISLGAPKTHSFIRAGRNDLVSRRTLFQVENPLLVLLNAGDLLKPLDSPQVDGIGGMSVSCVNVIRVLGRHDGANLRPSVFFREEFLRVQVPDFELGVFRASSSEENSMLPLRPTESLYRTIMSTLHDRNLTLQRPNVGLFVASSREKEITLRRPLYVTDFLAVKAILLYYRNLHSEIREDYFLVQRTRKYLCVPIHRPNPALMKPQDLCVLLRLHIPNVQLSNGVSDCEQSSFGVPGQGGYFLVIEGLVNLFYFVVCVAVHENPVGQNDCNSVLGGPGNHLIVEVVFEAWDFEDFGGLSGLLLGQLFGFDLLFRVDAVIF